MSPSADALGRASAAPRWRLVVADDDAEMRAWIRLVIGHGRAEFVDAASGWELLQLLADEGPFDLAITDLRMPPPNGLNVVTMARTAGLATPFLVVTAFPDAELRRAIAQVPGAAVLAKPCSGRALLAASARLIAASRPELAGSASPR